MSLRTSPHEIDIGGVDDYARAKSLLNKARHPTFIGRNQVTKLATNGGLIFFTRDGVDVGLVIVNVRTSTLIVMAVVRDEQNSGLGTAMLRYAKPNWIRAVESAVAFFEARGYVSIGDWKQGRSLRTRILARVGLFDLAGRMSQRIRAARAQLSERAK